jgi:hypothetical protein
LGDVISFEQQQYRGLRIFLENLERQLMKKVLMTVIALFAISGNAQAINIDAPLGGAGDDKASVTGFGQGDLLRSVSTESGNTTPTLFDVNTPVDGSTTTQTSGLTAGVSFVHDYIFSAVQNTMVAISSAVENSQPSQQIGGLFVEVWKLVAGQNNSMRLGREEVVQTSIPSATSGIVNVQMMAGMNYVVRVIGETVPAVAEYTLRVQAVPVPAAVWLFGTAMLGLIGFRRKSAASPIAA